MASDLRLRVGGVTAMVTFGGTDQQIAAALTRFAASLGIPVTGTATENLTAILEHIRDDVRRKAKQQQRVELQAASNANIEAQVETDNPI